ncbi:PepSY-associated TM helix domain-containing protein [Oryzibacter oryziterrae]|uniref:PepSY-associated TM helix domain-containing protein n=1 Tax=Oryzibacter oryziterrae TaxID=2766474 RepID=UPI001F3B3062|nr:PepSY domain-containing protein [Oryzibacter oryziterrae]
MTTLNATEAAVPSRRETNRLYFAAWRWHFYAGLYVIPFLLMLAVTGLVMMIYAKASNEYGWVDNVAVGSTVQPPSALAEAALAAVPDGTLSTYIAPQADNRPAFFEVSLGDGTYGVAVDPYTAKVVRLTDMSSSVRNVAEKIHGTLLIGTVGDRLIEIAASLGMVLIATGVYLWWPRDRSLGRALVPRLNLKGRLLWKELHATSAIWMSVFLVLFLLSGLSWAGIWGEKFAQPWSTFPSNKWDNVPLSDVTYASLNKGVLHQVPWTLEKAPLPASGSQAGTPAVTQPVALDSVVMWAAAHGFTGQYKVSLPGGDTGVYTVAYDSRNGDSVDPSQDRFVHIDRYTGNILADVRYADYPVGGKAMAWGIALHKGMAGTWNFVFNVAYLALVVFLCVSGLVMWWKRRPSGALRLAAPPLPADLPHWKGAVTVMLLISLAFPLAGVTLLAVLVLDTLILARIPALRGVLN